MIDGYIVDVLEIYVLLWEKQLKQNGKVYFSLKVILDSFKFIVEVWDMVSTWK